MKRLKVPVAFAAPLALTAGLWLVLVYRSAGETGGSDPPLVLHAVRDALFAFPLVLVAVWLGHRLADNMLARRGDAETHGLAAAVTVAAIALAAAAATAVTVPISQDVLGLHSGAALPLPLLMLRDGLLALFVTVPVSAALVALARRTERTDPVPETGGHRTSRAAFLKAGAGGLVTIAGGTAALRAVSSSSAVASSTVKVSLLINEGYVKMTDGSPAFMRGFGIDATTGAPMVPGPALGPPIASVPIGDISFVLEGQPVEVTIKNTLAEPHTFTIPGVVDPPIVIGPGATTTVTINTPTAPVAAGTYFYADDDPIQRVIGLHGSFVVMPGDATRRPYVNRPDLLAPPTFEQQFSWIFNDVDPVWGEKARLRQPIDIATFLPRYFTINGVSGEQSVASRRNLAARTVNADGVVGHGTLYRIVNVGLAFHSPHFHGNHVYILTQNGRLPTIGGVPALSATGRPIAVEKDVFGIESTGRREVLLPFHTPYDQFPLYDPANSPNYRYPMHCHAEMSQTAGGGQYPSGMYTEWELSGPLGPPKPPAGG
jgi:hypothetical protein